MIILNYSCVVCENEINQSCNINNLQKDSDYEINDQANDAVSQNMATM